MYQWCHTCIIIGYILFFSHCTALTPNVTTSVASVIQERSLATLTCTAVLTAPTTSDVMVVISWSKDGHQLYNNDHLLITLSNATATSFQSNVTIIALEISDRGDYSCEVVLHSTSTQSSISPPTVSTLSLEVEGMHLHTSLIRQLFIHVKERTGLMNGCGVHCVIILYLCISSFFKRAIPTEADWSWLL